MCDACPNYFVKRNEKRAASSKSSIDARRYWLLFVYLVEQLTNKSEPLKILDPASGMGITVNGSAEP